MVTLLRAWQVKQLLLITIGVVITTLICSACSSVSTVTVTVTVIPSPRATATSTPIPTATLVPTVPTAIACPAGSGGPPPPSGVPLPPGTVVTGLNAASQQVFYALCTPGGTQDSIDIFLTTHLPSEGWHLFNPSKDFTGCALLNPSHNSIWAKDSAHAGSTLTWTIGPLPSWMMNECTNYEPPPSS